MAKIKLAGKKSGKTNDLSNYRGAIPCLIVVLGGMILVFLLLFASLQSANR
jgi:hypothetical protein